MFPIVRLSGFQCILCPKQNRIPNTYRYWILGSLFAFCFPSRPPRAFLWSSSKSPDPTLGSWARGKWAEIILPEHWLWVVAKAVSPTSSSCCFHFAASGAGHPVNNALMTAHWRKKQSLARLVTRETFQVSNELGQISPLECAAVGLASVRIPGTFPRSL